MRQIVLGGQRDQTTAAGAVAAASLITGAPWIQKVKGANSKISYGFIGTGSRGQYLLKHLKGIDNGLCTAVCDLYQPNLDKGAETIGTNPKKFKDYRELLSASNLASRQLNRNGVYTNLWTSPVIFPNPDHAGGGDVFPGTRF